MQEVSDIWSMLEEVNDPELPVLSVIDLGIIREIKANGQNVEVVVTPTYSGCPAMNRIEWDIRAVLLANGYAQVKIITMLSPAWTTDWMSEAGKQKLKAYGIAPPHPASPVCDIRLFQELQAVQCPQCDSYSTRVISQFGSTACKALYQCNDCQEPFDYFKCH